MKLCLIYNLAQHYRANIFKLISEEFDCDFIFGNSSKDIANILILFVKQTPSLGSINHPL